MEGVGRRMLWDVGALVAGDDLRRPRPYDREPVVPYGLGTIVVAADLRRLHVETAVPTELLLGVELGASPAGEPYIVGTAHFRKCIVQLLHHRVDTVRRGGGRFVGEEHLASPVGSNVGGVGPPVRRGGWRARASAHV